MTEARAQSVTDVVEAFAEAFVDHDLVEWSDVQRYVDALIEAVRAEERTRLSLPSDPDVLYELEPGSEHDSH